MAKDLLVVLTIQNNCQRTCGVSIQDYGASEHGIRNGGTSGVYHNVENKPPGRCAACIMFFRE
ncbi:hypothetical protein MUK42_34283 [Musa troglodytarum]|uniref:Uncharacterized protein n=1 Tax=Musa troglodytarum TaxID=320322 RepID=A0A9E7EHC7_9LILI|nr:hypothetical protein MUK42_34283 [Musa troglodytarum]